MQTAIVVSNAVFRALTESSPDGIVLVDQEVHIALVNLQTEKLFGDRREELLTKQQSCEDVIRRSVRASPSET